MSEVWLTHPQLTPAHDFKCLPAAIGSWMGSGWQVREDQTDPTVVSEPADPRQVDASESPAPSGSSKSSPLPRKES